MRIGITQHVLTREDRGEVWDGQDQRLSALLAGLGHAPIPLSNMVPDAAAYAAALGLEGVILSGGNDLSALPGGRNVSAGRDAFEAALVAYFSRRALPVLGICRGLQFLNHCHGGGLERRDGHAGTRHKVAAGPAALAAWPVAFEVNSFHGWVIPDGALASALQPMAFAPDGTIEAARHARLPLIGVMWHPEREGALAGWDAAIFAELFGRM
jgi:N5-(cytidine 5'-diphosphoramidyl)-L-glutamine hydrolase